MKLKWVKGGDVGADQWQSIKAFVALPHDLGLNVE